MKLTYKIDGIKVMRKVILTILNEWEWKEDVTDEYKKGFNEFGNTLIEMLDNTDKDIPDATDWIPCSERLPEERVDVLVSFGDEYPVIAWYSEINNHWKNSSTDIPISMDIIAWMPLPEPYKEKNNGKKHESEKENA